MKIKDLISKLQTFDPEMMVVVDESFEGGYSDILSFNLVKVELNVKESGRISMSQHELTENANTPVLVLSKFDEFDNNFTKGLKNQI